MANTLYLECYSGISGDMTVAALLDLGADRAVLKKALDSLPIGGFDVRIDRVKKSGLDACDFAVVLDGEHENHDHDMEYLHGDSAHAKEQPQQEHLHPNGQSHPHEHSHEHTHDHDHTHKHRGLAEILHIIEHAEISAKAKHTAKRIFEILAEAEAKAHGLPIEEVHFHEVGAVDSIVDIVAIAVCLDNLDIDQVIVPELYEGRGFVRCQHGVIPVPVPAVVNIAEKHGIRLHLTKTEGELVTPTGAAVVAAVATSRTSPEHFTIKKTGLGAGKRTYDRPSLLRAMLIEPQDIRDDRRETERDLEKCGAEQDLVYRLETNIDDCSGEQLGVVMGRLFDAGARDVHYIPVFMKKNRPAYLLAVICNEEQIPVMEQIIFEETTTIGIRRTAMERTVLKRENITQETPIGKADVKVCRLPDGSRRYYPEYEQTVSLAKRNQISYMEAYRIIQTAAETEAE